MESTNDVHKARENRIRRHARRLGLALQKSRARYIHIDNFGGYMLIDPDRKAIVSGSKYELSLDEVEDFLNDFEHRLVSG